MREGGRDRGREGGREGKREGKRWINENMSAQSGRKSVGKCFFLHKTEFYLL